MECLSGGRRKHAARRCFADTAVVAYALCTIPGAAGALAEIHRVLKPGGRLVFLEHGQAEPGMCRGLQNGLNRVWGALAGGCNPIVTQFGSCGTRFDVSEAIAGEISAELLAIGQPLLRHRLDVTYVDVKAPDMSFTNAIAVVPTLHPPEYTA